MRRTFTSAALAALVVITTLGVSPVAAQSRKSIIAPPHIASDPIDVQLDLDGLAFELANLDDQVDAVLSARLQSAPPVRGPDHRPLVVMRSVRNADGAYQNGT